MLEFKKQISEALAGLTGMEPGAVAEHLEVPPEREMGEYAFPCFVLARHLKKPPPRIAEELASQIAAGGLLGEARPVGPYLNFYVNRAGLASRLLPEILREGGHHGYTNEGEGRTAVIDYSAPNIAKPFGVGHLRSTVIGNALYRIFEALGFRAVGINHLGDWGTQFGKLIAAYRRWGDSSRLKEAPVEYLYQLYVQFHREAEEDASLEEEGRFWFRKLEEGEKEATALWEQFRELSLQEFQRIYDLLGVRFDAYQGESFYNRQLEDVVRLAREKGLARESEGAVVADLEPYGLPPCLLQKKDGATLYITRDLAAAIYRYRTYRFDRLLYVVGAEQSLHFQQLFKMLEVLGFPWADSCIHVPFGLIRFKEGRMSTRLGRVILLEEVLERAVELAHEIIREKNPALEDKEKAARAVGYGAVIFGDLVNDRQKDIEFDWEKVLDFSGETAPYVQYSHARICSILRKAGLNPGSFPPADPPPVDPGPDPGGELLQDEEEGQLLVTLARFREQLQRSAADCRPSYLARYLIELARDFNKFYHNCPVLHAEEKTRGQRLLLCEGVRTVLQNGLYLLGVEAPDRM